MDSIKTGHLISAAKVRYGARILNNSQKKLLLHLFKTQACN
jgi:hypothetical protein